MTHTKIFFQRDFLSRPAQIFFWAGDFILALPQATSIASRKYSPPGARRTGWRFWLLCGVRLLVTEGNQAMNHDGGSDEHAGDATLGRRWCYPKRGPAGLPAPHRCTAGDARSRGNRRSGHAKMDTTLVYARVALPYDVTPRLGVEVEH